MRRIVIALVATVGILFALLVGAVLMLPAFVSADTVRAEIARQIASTTGWKLRLDGPVAVTALPFLKLDAIDVGIAPPDSDVEMLAARRVSVGLAVMPLFSGNVRMTDLTLVEPRIVIGASDAPGAPVPDAQAPAGEAIESRAADAGGLSRLGIDRLSITDGVVASVDAEGRQQVIAQAINVRAKLPGFEKPVSLDGSLEYGGIVYDIDANLDNPAAVVAGEPAMLALEAKGEIGTLRLDGTMRAGREPGYDGHLLVATDSVADALAAFQMAPPEIEDLAGAGRVEAAVTVTPERIALSDMKIALGDYTGTGSLTAEAASGPYALTAKLAVEGLATLAFSGTFDPHGAVVGELDAGTPSLRRVAALAGQSLPAEGFGAAAFKGRIDASAERIAFDRAAFSLDGIQGTGSGRMTLAGRPAITARLAFGALDLTPYAGRGAAAEKPPRAARGQGAAPDGWSAEPIDIAALKAVDADIDVTAQSVRLDSVSLGRTHITAKLTGGILDASLSELQAYGGQARGSINLDSRSGLGVAANAEVADIDALSLLRDAAGFERVEGRANLSLSIRGAGRSMQALMSSLSGQARLEFRDGAIRGINIAQMLRSLSTRVLLGLEDNPAQKTDFSELSGTLHIENGIAVNDDLTLLGPLVRMTGAGRIDLAKQTVSYRVDPKIVTSLVGQGGEPELAGLGVPVVIEGAWTSPRIYPDIKGILQDPKAAFEQLKQLGDLDGIAKALAGGAGGVAGDAGGALQERIQAETGVDISGLVSDGKLDRDRLRQEAQKGLGRLLGLPEPAEQGSTTDAIAQPAGGRGQEMPTGLTGALSNLLGGNAPGGTGEASPNAAGAAAGAAANAPARGVTEAAVQAQPAPPDGTPFAGPPPPLPRARPQLAAIEAAPAGRPAAATTEPAPPAAPASDTVPPSTEATAAVAPATTTVLPPPRPAFVPQPQLQPQLQPNARDELLRRLFGR